MDLIILRNVTVDDIKTLGLLAFVETELNGAQMPQPVDYVRPIQPDDDADASAQEAPKEPVTKGRGRPKKITPEPEPAPEPMSEPAPAPEPPPEVTAESLRELCKTAIKRGVRHEEIVARFQAFVPGATLIAQVPVECWPDLAGKLKELCDAAN